MTRVDAPWLRAGRCAERARRARVRLWSAVSNPAESERARRWVTAWVLAAVEYVDQSATMGEP